MNWYNFTKIEKKITTSPQVKRKDPLTDSIEEDKELIIVKIKFH